MTAPARQAAFAALRAIGKARSDLGDALATTRDTLPDDRDRALATELVTGTLRARAALDYQLQQRIPRPLAKLDPEVLDTLRLGAFQLLHLTRVPPSAVVNDAVELCRTAGKGSARGLVNAVLRKLARERDTLVWPPRPEPGAPAHEWATWLEVEYSHPRWLIERWLKRYGLSDTEAWLRFNNQVPAVCVAANVHKGTRQDLATRLEAEGVHTAPARVSPLGLTVSEGHVLTTQAFRSGRCLVQDEASQLVPLLIGGAKGLTVYDACASPGGKSVVLAGTGARVISADVRPRRVRLLRDTLSRCDVAARVLQVAPDGPLPFLAATFDRILVDAPCSGLGTLRRDPDIRWRRNEADFLALQRTQLMLLDALAPLVRPNGRIVYSTCSSEPEENEYVVRLFLERHPTFRVVPLATVEDLPPALTAMATADGYLRTLPHRDGLEAFFGAVLAKL